MVLRLVYLATHALALLRLLPVSEREKDMEILIPNLVCQAPM
ncbi:hypothetical protein ABH940_003494 [Streptacidiphilus sp. BW17]